MFRSYAIIIFYQHLCIPELKKGFFPHKFHTPEHQFYDGPLPEKEYYDPKGMSKKKRNVNLKNGMPKKPPNTFFSNKEKNYLRTANRM